MCRRCDDRDVICDALALVQAAHADDWEGAMAVLANCRTSAVCVMLARIAADVIETMTDDADAALGWLREQHAPG